MKTYTFEQILDYNGFGYLPFKKVADDAYEIDITYNNSITLSFISSLISDLTNNGFNVFSNIKNNTAHIKAITNVLPSQTASIKNTRSKVISLAAAYYIVKKWVNKLNRQLQDLQVEVEKIEGDYNYGKKRQVTKRYSKGCTFYIINPEVNYKELIYIVDFLLDYGVPINREQLEPYNIYPVADNQFLLDQGYSANETYMAFPIDKDEINFNPYTNLKKGEPLVWKDTEVKEEEKK